MHKEYTNWTISQGKFLFYVWPIIVAVFCIEYWDNLVNKLPISLFGVLFFLFGQTCFTMAWFYPKPVLVVSDEGICYRLYSEDTVLWSDIIEASVVAFTKGNKTGRLIRLRLKNKDDFESGAGMSKQQLRWLSHYRMYNKNSGVIVIDTFRMYSAKTLILEEIERRCGLTIGTYPHWRI